LPKQKGGIMGYQGGGGGGFGGGSREMHKATCEECKKECEVPFKPSGDRPVYCKDCFSKRKGSR
jgi:CxxC-x17-CxxC domain-containing protein